MLFNQLNKILTVAEVGLNHNGDFEKAKRLIDIASVAGCTFVKFQVRDPELCVPEEQKNKPKRVPWREEETTYLQYKKDIEFSKKQYEDLFSYSRQKNLIPFASVWDVNSAEFLSTITDLVKIPSALLTDIKLLTLCNRLFPYRMLSTGMSTEEEIVKAVGLLDPQVIFHTNSTYPCPVEYLNLEYILHLKKIYPNKTIGYSNHYFGLMPCYASAALGAKVIEVHICEDHRDWGSDQSSSVEPIGLLKLTRGLQDLALALKGNHDRVPYLGEEEKRKSLRK